MANRPFDRTVINPREKPLSPDINQAQSQFDRTLREIVDRIHGGRIAYNNDGFARYGGFIGEGFKVRAANPVGMSVVVAQGAGFVDNTANVGNSIGGVQNVDDLAALAPVILADGPATFAVPNAPVAGQNRIDIIEVKVDRRLENPQSRRVLNTVTGVFDATNVNKTLAFALDGRTGIVAAGGGDSTAGLSYKTGTAAAAGSEVAPATTAGYVKIAEILVAGGVGSIAQNAIKDLRGLFTPYGLLRLVSTVSFLDDASITGSPTFALPPGVEGAWASAGNVQTGVGFKIGDASKWEVIAAQISLFPNENKVHVADLDPTITSMANLVKTADAAAQTQFSTGLPPMELAVGQSYIKIPFFIGEMAVTATTIGLNSIGTFAGSRMLQVGLDLRRKA